MQALIDGLSLHPALALCAVYGIVADVKADFEKVGAEQTAAQVLRRRNRSELAPHSYCDALTS